MAAVVLTVPPIGGLLRSLPFTGSNALNRVDVDAHEVRRATVLVDIAGRPSLPVGVAAAAIFFDLSRKFGERSTRAATAFGQPIAAVSAPSALAALWLRWPAPDEGAAVPEHAQRTGRDAAPGRRGPSESLGGSPRPNRPAVTAVSRQATIGGPAQGRAALRTRVHTDARDVGVVKNPLIHPQPSAAVPAVLHVDAGQSPAQVHAVQLPGDGSVEHVCRSRRHPYRPKDPSMPIDPALIMELSARRQRAALGGGAEKLAQRREQGRLSARERLDALFDAHTFLEFGMHAQHASHALGLTGKDLPADGVVTGIGYVDGRAVAAYAHDFTVGGGALGRIHARKVCDIVEYAMKAGIPVVGVNDSGGARIQEGVDSLSGYGQIFFRNVQASGLVPQIAIIAGQCAGGAAYSPALCDFLIMVSNAATQMFICGPQVIRAATGEEARLEQFATADAHAAVSGNIHFIASNDAHAIGIAHRLLGYLPSNNLDDPPHDPSSELSLAPVTALDELVPADPKMPFDVKAVIAHVVDAESFFEVMASFAPNIVVGFARIDGVVVGVVANQPLAKAGCLDIDASDKGARFVRTCNVYGVPLLTLVDVPGYMPGLAQERGGIIRHGAKMLFAYAASTVPKITVIMRKAYGGAYLAMCSSDLGADLVYAWPTAEIAVMGAEGAVRVIFAKELREAPDAEAKLAELIAQYREEFASPYQAAKGAQITDVITPSQTRGIVSLGLRTLLSKREVRPPKKHGNIPL